MNVRNKTIVVTGGGNVIGRQVVLLLLAKSARVAAAVKLLTEGLYAELLNTHVQVSIIFPGAIATDITANSGVEIHRVASDDPKKSNFSAMPAAKAAGMIINGIERGKTRIFIGKDSKMLNFLYSINPGYATRMVSRQMKSLVVE